MRGSVSDVVGNAVEKIVVLGKCAKVNVQIGDTALSYGIIRCTPQAFGCGKDKKLRNERFIVPAYSVQCFQKSCSVFPIKKTGFRHGCAFRSEAESVMEHIVLYIGKAGVQNLGKGTGMRFYSFSHTAALFQRTLALADITAVIASAGLYGIRKSGVLVSFSVGNADQVGKRQPGWIHFNVHSVPP